MKDLKNLSKEELIKLVTTLQSEKGMNENDIQEIIEECEENNMIHESFMESHGIIDYGYGTRCYGAI